MKPFSRIFKRIGEERGGLPEKVKKKPQEIEKRDYLAQMMADELEDSKSLGAFRVIASKVQEQVIFEQLAGVKEIWREGKVKQNRGALFVSFIQKYCSDHSIDLGFQWST